VVEPIVRTTLSKADTSSTEAPTTQALVAHRGSNASDDNLPDDNLDLLNFAMVGSWIAW
jgi:hypothetical protein